MRIKLEVRADTLDGITTGMYEAIRLLKKEARLQRGKDVKPYEIDRLKPFQSVDDNCYGELEMKVSNAR